MPRVDTGVTDLLTTLTAPFDVFDVRDAPSKELIGAGSHTSRSGDDAWLGLGDAGVYDTVTEAATRKFVFCLQSDLIGPGGAVTRLVDLVRGFIDAWSIDGSDVAIVEGIPGGDRVIYDMIADLLPKEFFVPFTEVWRWGLPARAGQTWISTRFHPHMLAAAAGARGVAVVGHQEYYATKHRSLTDSGSDWPVISTSTAPDTVRAGEGYSAEAVQRWRTSKSDLAAAIYPKLAPAPLRARARARLQAPRVRP